MMFGIADSCKICDDTRLVLSCSYSVMSLLRTYNGTEGPAGPVSTFMENCAKNKKRCKKSLPKVSLWTAVNQ